MEQLSRDSIFTATYRNGQLDGYSVHYNDAGEVVARYFYASGDLIGISEVIKDDSSVLLTVRLAPDKMRLRIKTDREGRQIYVMWFDRDERRHGLMETFEAGRKIGAAVYLHGQKIIEVDFPL